MKYTVSTKCSRWTKKFFEFQIDTSCVNAQTVWSLKSGKDPKQTDSFQFRIALGKGLVLPYMKERCSTPGLQKEIKRVMAIYVEFDDSNAEQNSDAKFPHPSSQGKILFDSICP